MYKIIIYKMIMFKIKQNYKEEHIKHYKDADDYDIAIGSTGRTITKRYYQKVKTINNIDNKELSAKYMEYKQIYKDSCYIFSLIKEDEEDWYFNNLNKKSEKAYIDYIKNGGSV